MTNTPNTAKADLVEREIERLEFNGWYPSAEVMRGLASALTAKEAEIAELRKASALLIAKLDEINEHPSFKGVFQMAAVHGFQYNGPNYVAELAALRAAFTQHQTPDTEERK